MIAVLAIDPATTTGWACSDGVSGAEPFGLRVRGTEPARHGMIARRFDLWLDTMLDRTQAGVLVMERQMTHGTSAHLLLGLRMIALVRAWRRQVAIEEVWVAQWRPWAKRELPWWHKDDELDARAMLTWWLAHRAPLLDDGSKS